MILAIDPGGTTGVAILSEDGLETAEVPNGFDGMSDYLVDILGWNIEAIVYEDYVPRPGAKSQQLDAMHIIGAIKHECRQRGIPCIKQTPTQAKSFATNDKLKAVGWYVVGEDHGRDAARHMLVFTVSHHPVALSDGYVQKRASILAALVAS